jgi:peptide/nickel transport system ATP-binding protein
MSEAILDVQHMSVDYKVQFGKIRVLKDISLSLRQGEVLSLVGESGSGKTTFALAVAKLLAPNSVVSKDTHVFFRGRDIMNIKRSEMDKIRGTEIFMIFQNPFMSLNPLMKIKAQLGEAIAVRNKRRRRGSEENKKTNGIEEEISSVLKSVRIGDSKEIMERYPHQLSGGQNQRVMLAMALAERPSLLIADEPSTALDVTTQAQVLALIKEAIKNTGMSMIFITHDLAIAGSISDRIAVLYGGMVQEIGTAKDILSDPKHPYTVGLIESIPSKSKKEGHLEAIKGSYNPAGLENMCLFAPRCPLVQGICREQMPELVQLQGEHYVRCVNYVVRK